MIAQRIAGIMPAPSLDEFLEILAVQSAAGLSLSGEAQSFARPFRAPHHTISEVGLIGGGSNPGPGEISLAHHGVLFLDELPEFRRSTLEVMRQPLEDGEVTISRSAGKVTLPAAAMLVAAMNPCPCGYLGDPRHECRCTPTMIQRYRSRISGPLLDRIDLHVEAPALSFEDLRSERPCESSASIRARVEDARALQARRYGSAEGSTPADSTPAATATTGDTATPNDSATPADTQHSAAHLSATAAATATINDTGAHSDTAIHTPAEHHTETATAAGAPRCNARMSHRQLRRFCALDKEQADLLQQAMEELSLSARAYDRILKVARTIADLETSETIQTHHLLEAIQYRSLDRRLFY